MTWGPGLDGGDWRSRVSSRCQAGELGREVLSFIEGHVAWEPAQPPSVTSDASLARLAGLVREFHATLAAYL